MNHTESSTESAQRIVGDQSIVAQDEINRFNLVSNSLTLNSQTNKIYALESVSSIDQLKHPSTTFRNESITNEVNASTEPPSLPETAVVNQPTPVDETSIINEVPLDNGILILDESRLTTQLLVCEIDIHHWSTDDLKNHLPLIISHHNQIVKEKNDIVIENQRLNVKSTELEEELKILRNQINGMKQSTNG